MSPTVSKLGSGDKNPSRIPMVSYKSIYFAILKLMATSSKSEMLLRYCIVGIMWPNFVPKLNNILYALLVSFTFLPYRVHIP